MKKLGYIIGGYLAVGVAVFALSHAENKWRNPLNYLTILLWPLYAREIITTTIRNA